ncbi:MAG: hypothetical protein RR140_01960 [Clostridia bacterium]
MKFMYYNLRKFYGSEQEISREKRRTQELIEKNGHECEVLRGDLHNLPAPTNQDIADPKTLEKARQREINKINALYKYDIVERMKYLAHCNNILRTTEYIVENNPKIAEKKTLEYKFNPKGLSWEELVTKYFDPKAKTGKREIRCYEKQLDSIKQDLCDDLNLVLSELDYIISLITYPDKNLNQDIKFSLQDRIIYLTQKLNSTLSTTFKIRPDEDVLNFDFN